MGRKTYELLELRKVLFRLNPDSGYSVWFRALAAIHHATGGSEEAFELVDEWSSHGYEKYRNADDVRRQWRSLRSGQSKPITLGTLKWLIDQQHTEDRHWL